MAEIKVKLDWRTIDAQLQHRFEQVNNPTTMIAIYNTLAKRCDPYVPFLEGPLSQTFQVSAEGVRYIQPYARYQYYGDTFRHTTEFHPLASARWDKAMLRDHRLEFNQEVKAIMQLRLDKVNG